MATRSAPTVDGTGSFLNVSLHWIDTAGDVRSDAYMFPTGSLDSAIETFAAAMQLYSNASLWRVDVDMAYNSIPSKANATAAVHESADDVLNILEKDPSTQQAQDVVIRAPVTSLFVAGTFDPNPAAAGLDAIADAFEALTTSTVRVSYRFSEHRDIGKRVRA